MDERYVEVEASTRCQVRASPPSDPARWSRWDRALLGSWLSEDFQDPGPDAAPWVLLALGELIDDHTPARS